MRARNRVERIADVSGVSAFKGRRKVVGDILGVFEIVSRVKFCGLIMLVYSNSEVIFAKRAVFIFDALRVLIPVLNRARATQHLDVKQRSQSSRIIDLKINDKTDLCGHLRTRLQLSPLRQQTDACF